MNYKHPLIVFKAIHSPLPMCGGMTTARMGASMSGTRINTRDTFCDRMGHGGTEESGNPHILESLGTT